MCCRKLLTSQIDKNKFKKKANAIKKRGQANPSGMIHWNYFSGIYIYELWGFCGFFFLLKWLWTRVITYHFHFNSIWQIVLDGESNTASLNGYSVSASCRALNALCYRSLDRTQAEYLICYKAEMWQGWINLLAYLKLNFKTFFLTNLSFSLSSLYFFFFRSSCSMFQLFRLGEETLAYCSLQYFNCPFYDCLDIMQMHVCGEKTFPPLVIR